MSNTRKNKRNHDVTRIVAIYAVVGSLWVCISGIILDWLVHDPMTISRLDTVKGFIFILLTSSLLYLLMYRYSQQLTTFERSLRESGERFRSIFELAAVGVALVDPHTGKIVQYNTKYCDITGYSAEEMVGRTFLDITHPDDRHIDLDNTAHVLAGSIKTFSREKRYIHRNGSIVWVNLTVSPQWLDGQEPSYKIAFVEDITTRKAAETALMLSEERYRKMAEGQTDAICRITADGTYLFVNDAYCRILGKSRDELLGSSWHPVALADDLKNIEEQLRLLSPLNPVVTIENRVYLGSRDICWMQFVNSGFFDNEGRLVEVQSVGRDISGRKQAEEDRLILEQQFQQAQKMESLGVLAGSVAHDFNNILTIILGHCHILNKEIDSGMTLKEHVKQIEAAGSRAVGLCRQMLRYAGQRTQVQAMVDTWLLVEGAVKMLASAFKTNVSVKLDLKRDVPELTADYVQIQQVVMNLIINAAEAIGDKSGTINVALKKAHIQAGQSDTDFMGTTIPAREYACLDVSDNGCGIEKEIEKRIFEPFYTTKSAGRGLGMSAVLGIVKSYDGALRLTSSPGVGTSIQVYFPLQENVCEIETPQKAWFVPSAKVNGTVLLVDDEAAMRVIGSALLKAMGFSTITASNGREALEIYSLRKSGIDLILMDLIMPVMGGMESYRMMREISPSVPVVICSGQSVEGILEDIGSDGCTAVIQKPYKPDQLRDTLMNLLDKKGSTFP